MTVGSAGLAVVAVAAALGFGAPAARAAIRVDESFGNATLSDPTAWVLTHVSGSDPPCLTAAENSSPPQPLAEGSIGGCVNPAIVDPAGSGVLRLTNARTGQGGMLMYNTPLLTAGGTEVTFDLAQYGGTAAFGSTGDGISFFLKDGANHNNAPGASGRGLGYSLNGSTRGIPGGLFGIGFDKFGGFANVEAGSSTCTPAPHGSNNAIAIRGADTSPNRDGREGFCWLGGTLPNAIDYNGSTRTAAARAVRIVVDPATDAHPMISVYFGRVGQPLPSTPTLRVAAPQEYKNARTFKFGFAASTGSATNIHEVWGRSVTA